MLLIAALLQVSLASAEDCPLGHYLPYRVHSCTPCPQGTFSNIVNAVACRPCPKDQYSSVLGAVQCMSCPDTAYTVAEGSKSEDDCVGPVMEICSQEDFQGDCYKFYDDNMKVDMTIKSLRVIRGEFKVFEKAELTGNVITIKEGFEARNASGTVLSAIGSFSILINDVFCYVEKGANFRGNFAKAQSDDCINWNRTSLAQFAKPNNLCQNPDPTGSRDKPFCYVLETSAKTCDDIPRCGWEQDCYTGSGEGYRGTVNTTQGGKRCQNWESNFPHYHGYHAGEYGWAGIGDHNYCRTPDKGGRPWCYTSNILVRWDYCHVPTCNRDEYPLYTV